MPELVPYTVAGAPYDAYVVRPTAPGPRPAVLVVHAFSGRDAFAEARAAELARLGYVGVAIDLYGVGVRGRDRAESGALMRALLDDPAALSARLSAAVTRVCELRGVAADRLGAIGYCFGGLCALRMSRMGLPLRAVVSFHGLLRVGPGLDGPASAPMLILHGADDPMVPPEHIASFAEEMRRIGADWTLHAFPGVVHAFTNPAANAPELGTVYNAHADAVSWAEASAFLSRHLGP